MLEALKAEEIGEEVRIARAYGIRQLTLANWKRYLLQHGAEVFG